MTEEEQKTFDERVKKYLSENLEVCLDRDSSRNYEVRINVELKLCGKVISSDYCGFNIGVE